MLKRTFITPVGNEGIYTLDTGSWRTLKPIMNKEKCTECGICMTYCPVNSIIGDKEKKYQIDYKFCKGCGICAHECPSKAIDMKKEGGEV
jgi:pyruvate ferredoxin oxidoreductase delta subunit